MNFIVTDNQVNTVEQKLLTFYYNEYSRKLLTYTERHYLIPEDDASNLMYKTIYRMAEVHHKYEFVSEQKRNAFVFTTHINFIRNYFRDEKRFENKCKIVPLEAAERGESAPPDATNNLALTILQVELEKLQEWQRILLLMRGQDVPYSEIAPFTGRPEKQLKTYYLRLKKQLFQKVNAELKKLKQKHDEK